MQVVPIFFQRIGINRFWIWAMNFFACKCIGRFIDATTLDGIGAPYIIQSPVSKMSAFVVKGVELVIFIKHDKHSNGQASSFKPDC